MYKELDDNFRSISFDFSFSLLAGWYIYYIILYIVEVRRLRNGVKLDTFPSIGEAASACLLSYTISMAAVTECRSCGSR
jgi:hypothetical protein